MIELLEYLILSIGTFSGSGKKVEITVDNGCVSAKSFEVSNPEQQDIKKLSRKKSKVWLEELESIGINRWKPRYHTPYILDGTQWELEYKYDGKRCRHISGCNAFPENWDDFLEVMDKITPFIEPDRIELIKLDFRNLVDSISATPKHNICSETLVISRKDGTLILLQNTGAGQDVTLTYKDLRRVRDVIKMCAEFIEEFEDMQMDDEGYPEYELRIKYYKKPELKLKGTYNRRCLPSNWSVFIEKIYSSIKHSSFVWDIFHPQFYNRGVKPGEYIFCSVSFEEYGKTYYYLTDDDTLEIGDEVLVPVGKNNILKTAVVEDIEYYTEDTVPFPLDKIKRIVL